MKHIFLFFILLAACSMPPEEIRDFNRVGNAIRKRLQDEDNLNVNAIGYLGPGKFKGIEIGIRCNSEADIPLARAHMVHVIKKIVQIANQDERFKDDLDKSPLEVTHLLLSISFISLNNSLSCDTHIAIAVIAHGEISYYKEDPVTENFVEVYSEDFKTALEELKS